MSLDDTKRTAALNMYYDGYSAATVAKELKLSDSSVERWVRARRAQGNEPERGELKRASRGTWTGAKPSAKTKPKPLAKEVRSIVAKPKGKPGPKPKPKPVDVAARVGRVELAGTSVEQLQRENRVLRIERDALRAAFDAIGGL